MERQEYILKPSLKQMALRKIPIILWNHADLLPLVKEFYPKQPYFFSWIKFAEDLIIRMKEKASKLILPNLLRQELMHVIPGIVTEIIRWQMNHRFLICDSINQVDHLCWTSYGTVDYSETAKRIIRQEQVDIIIRYKLSCLNCLEDDIKAIWSKLCDDCKQSFYTKENNKCGREENIVCFWTNFITGNEDNLEDWIYEDESDDEVEVTLFQHWFGIAALDGNKVATEYFLKKLTYEEREASLVEITLRVVKKCCADIYDMRPYDFPPKSFSAVLVYLLSQMREEQQIQVFKNHPENIFHCLLDWPWQDLFMKVAGLMWPFLSLKDYQRILSNLCRDHRICACDYMSLFIEFFLQAPSHYRTGVLGNHSKCKSLIISVFHSENTECFKLVLRNITNAVKEELINDSTILHLCPILINDKNWDVLELFVEEFTFSNEMRRRLKECFMKFIIDFGQKYYNDYKSLDFEKFFQILDNAKVGD